MTMHLDRQAIDVQCQLPGTLTFLQRGQAPDHQPQQAFVYDIDIVVAPEAVQQPRQRGLRRPLNSTRAEPLHEGVQVDRLSPMADGSPGSGSWRNTLNFQENTIRYLRFQAGLLNKPGSQIMVDKVHTIPREKIGQTMGQLDDAAMIEVNRAMTLFLGFA